ncbi:uncharacterized protein BJ171DRAFT_627171 [Polychytrium aggregatum]|uniref:uncharacterized protein n=1 Tax=Polychytrium aggregatum TaxID=110093 RepID=UPI0022FDFDED|nr:uncharacterized protein BJ171DRAFT_627171 [Polychytrium aggregatum]KAI9209047.1 hypothetical protein BJ171DRAFT_627171 [Polychytrium aggregatum]
MRHGAKARAMHPVPGGSGLLGTLGSAGRLCRSIVETGERPAVVTRGDLLNCMWLSGLVLVTYCMFMEAGACIQERHGQELYTLRTCRSCMVTSRRTRHRRGETMLCKPRRTNGRPKRKLVPGEGGGWCEKRVLVRRADAAITSTQPTQGSSRPATTTWVWKEQADGMRMACGWQADGRRTREQAIAPAIAGWGREQAGAEGTRYVPQGAARAARWDRWDRRRGRGRRQETGKGAGRHQPRGEERRAGARAQTRGAARHCRQWGDQADDYGQGGSTSGLCLRHSTVAPSVAPKCELTRRHAQGADMRRGDGREPGEAANIGQRPTTAVRRQSGRLRRRPCNRRRQEQSRLGRPGPRDTRRGQTGDTASDGAGGRRGAAQWAAQAAQTRQRQTTRCRQGPISRETSCHCGCLAGWRGAADGTEDNGDAASDSKGTRSHRQGTAAKDAARPARHRAQGASPEASIGRGGGRSTLCGAAGGCVTPRGRQQHSGDTGT